VCKKRARVYMCTENPGISVESLSHARSRSVFIVSECVSIVFVKLQFQISRDPFRSGAVRIGLAL
jgi:hypothetical protein